MKNTEDPFRIRICSIAAVTPLALVGFAIIGIQFSDGATAVSRIFGAVPVVAQGESDTALSLPMKVPAVFRAAVGSVGSAITVPGTPNLTDNHFVYSEGVQPQTYYLFFESGGLAGRHFRITGNTSSTISVADPKGELAGAAADDIVAVHPYWTLATLFSSDQGLPAAAKAYLAEEGYDPVMGARPLRRTIQSKVEDLLSEKILFGEIRSGSIVVVDLEGTGDAAELSFKSTPQAELPDAPPVEQVADTDS